MMQDNIDIIIPSIKKINEIQNLLNEIKTKSKNNINIITICENNSSAINRNKGLNLAQNHYRIMMDDDICDLPIGWDHELISIIKMNENIIMVSARLMINKNKVGPMAGKNYNLNNNIVESFILPSACILFKYDNIRFDEKYLGSGYEDADFCMQFKKRYPNKKFIINNEVKVVHRNEMKNQTEVIERNMQYFIKKWGIEDIDKYTT